MPGHIVTAAVAVLVVLAVPAAAAAGQGELCSTGVLAGRDPRARHCTALMCLIVKWLMHTNLAAVAVHKNCVAVLPWRRCVAALHCHGANAVQMVIDCTSSGVLETTFTTLTCITVTPSYMHYSHT